MRIPLTLLAIVMFILGTKLPAAAASEGRARLAVTIDYLDVVAAANRPLKEQDIDQMMADIAQAGFDRVYFRVDAAGTLHYRTKVGTQFRDYGRGKLSQDMLASWDNLVDPLRVAAEAARRHKLEFYAWMPPRDQDSNENRYNFYDPDEREQFIRVGSDPFLCDFLARNPHFQLERREGFIYFTGKLVPRVKWLELRTLNKDQTVTPDDVRLLCSWDNLIYEPVPDTWTVTAGRDGEHYVYRIGPLDIHAPWIKVAQRHFGKWEFLGGLGGKPCFTLYDPQDKPIPTGTWWLRYADRHPETGEVCSPYSGASRPGWAFSFDHRGNSTSIFVPPFPPRRYLTGAPCFAYPEVRNYYTQLIAELSEYPIQGVMLSARTHVRSARGDDYGFNPPIVEEYRKKYGVDIRTQDFDRAKWLEIRGNYYTEMLQNMSRILHKKRQKLIAIYEPPLDSGAYQGAGDHLVGQDQGPFDWQWKKWTDNAIVDTIMAGTIGFEMGWTPQLAQYTAGVRKQMKRGEISIFYNPAFDTKPATFKAFLTAALADPNVAEVAIYEYIEVAPGTALNKVLMEMQANN